MDKCQEQARQRAYYLLRKKPTDKRCQDCGILLPHGKQTYCLDCLLRAYIRTKGDSGNERKKIRHRLYNRGLDSKEIEYEIKKRGIG